MKTRSEFRIAFVSMIVGIVAGVFVQYTVIRTTAEAHAYKAQADQFECRVVLKDVKWVK